MIFFLLGLFIINSKSNDKTEVYIKSVIEWHVLLLTAIYALSYLQKLNALWLSSIFIMADILVWGYIIKTRSCMICKPDLDFSRYKIWGIPFMMILLVLWFSLDTVPYNWDSMTYHLPRLAHWTQNQSVGPYATNIDRQVGSTTLTSYVALAVYIFSGKSDMFLNLVQCMAYITNALIIYRITQKCGGNKNFSIVATIVYLAMPIAFAEATTTQNDNYSAMWLLFFFYLLIDLLDKNKVIQYNRQNRDKVVFAAISMGFGYLAKPSVCFAMVVLLCFVLWNVLRRKDKLKDIFSLLAISMGVFIITILPQFIFNIYVYGNALPDNVGKRQLVGTWYPNYLFVNMIRNYTYNLGNSWVPKSKEFLAECMYWLADVFNVILDDPTISEDGGLFGFSSHPYGCDTALNPLILTLAIFSVMWCLSHLKKQNSNQVQVTLYAMISYVVFCFFLRWEHFISRYLLPYFALFCPIIAIQAQNIYFTIKKRIFQKSFITILCLLLFVNYYFVIENTYRIETKEYPDSYFYHVGSIRNDYIDICDNILEKQYDEIGIIVGSNSYEYPLWGILNSQKENFVIKHVKVDNELGVYEDKEFCPDCIFAIDREGDDIIVINGREYNKVISYEDNSLFLYERKEEKSSLGEL